MHRVLSIRLVTLSIRCAIALFPKIFIVDRLPEGEMEWKGLGNVLHA